MTYAIGTTLICRESGSGTYVVFSSNPEMTRYIGTDGVCIGTSKTENVIENFIVSAPAVTQSALDTQVDGDHYKKLGDYQPWEVLRHWLTPEEFRGYMKGTAIAYLAREQDKGGTTDIAKATHTLQGLLEIVGVK